MIHRQTRSAAKRDRIVAMAAMLFLMAFAAPATAMAASPVTDQYGSRSQQVAATGGGGSPGSGSSSGVGVNSAPTTGHGASGNAIGGLPFTGLDLAVLALAAIALLGGGFALRLLSDPTRHS